jgi:hypothetical protein
MFCPECGKELPADSHFCPACGHVTAQGGAASPTAAAAPMAAPVARVPESGGFMAWLRRMKTWKKVLIGIFVFIVGVVSLAMCMTSGLDEPVNRHFDALHAGDITAAYAELAIATRHDVSEADFKAMLERNPALTHVIGHSFSSRNWNDGQGTLEGTLELDGGGRLPITVRLVKENDQWKILSYHVTSSPPPQQ